MTLPIERARTRRPVTWLTILGVLLLPVVIGGILVASLYNPVERLDALNAAVVNQDDPVTIDDQLVPLGRQLTAGLVEGSDDLDSNLTWTISNADDAAEGLADGTYDAVVTIPGNFSAAATSTRPGETPEQATIQVQTSPDALVVDEAITAQVTQAAASIMGEQISQLYLENVFLGFTTLGDQLGDAADGAAQLADGAQQAADGAAKLPGGASQLASGAGSISSGATSLAGGLDTIAGGIGSAANGARDLASGLDGAATKVLAPELVGAADAAARYAGDAARETSTLAPAVGGVAKSAGALSQTLSGLSDDCLASGASTAYCDRVAAALASAQSLAQSAGATAEDAVTAATSAGTASGYATPTAAGVTTLTSETSAGLTDAAAGARGLGTGLDKLAAGTTQSATGARGLAAGAAQLSTGGSELSTGAQSLADGIAALATGTDDLATGLETASTSIPGYTDAEAASLADVVSNPVAAEGTGSNLFGASAIPLLATAALWFGGLATFVALRAVSRRSLASRAPSGALALRAFLPAAGIGALQGLLVAVVVQIAASYDMGTWSVFAGLAVAAGIAFAAVNQALVAVFGGGGRWIAALVGALLIATGVVSTVPGPIAAVAAVMPTAPAYDGMVAALAETSGISAALAGLAIWGVLSLVATMLAVARRRTISARTLRAGSPATA